MYFLKKGKSEREREGDIEEEEEGAQHSASLLLKTNPSHFGPCDL